MDKCLVTKLAQAVDYNDLPILGELRINIDSSASITVRSSKKQILTITDGYTFPSTESSTYELLANSTKVVSLPEGRFVLKFEDKYSIENLSVAYTNKPTCKVNFEDLEYIPNLNELSNFILEGDLEILPKSLKVLSSAGVQEESYGNLSDFVNLTTCSVVSSQVEGDLSGWMSLENITLSGSTKISGELSDKPNINNITMNKNSRFTWSASAINSLAKLPMLVNVNVSDVNQCLKDLSARTTSAYSGGITTFNLYGDNFTPSDPEVKSAIETLKAANTGIGKKEWNVKINDVPY